MNRCLDDEEALLYVTGGLATSVTEIAEHLGSCESCFVRLAEAARTIGDTGQTGTLDAGTVLGERYEIVRFIARGGMGEVYEAHDRSLKETVALKTLVCYRLDDPLAAARLRREVQLARRITHPNVCRILEFGVGQDRPGKLLPFFTMPFLQGETLGSRLRRSGPFAEAAAEAIFAQVLEGLAAIHAAGIVHRDLKSDNIFLVPMAEGGERAVIMDFGLARPLVRTPGLTALTVEGLVGTPDYMAPEQLAGASPTVAFDVYAFGVVMFETLTGRRPRALQNNLPSGRLVVPSDVNPTLRRRWDGIIRSCLAPEVASRPADVAALRRALLQARKPAWRRVVSQRRLWVGAGLLVVGTWSATLALRTEGARHRRGPVRANVARLVGTPEELRPRLRPLLRPSGTVVCLEILPGGNSFRIITEQPLEALDVDLTSGATRPAPLLPETYEKVDGYGCPVLSPDGQRLLFVRHNNRRRSPQIMLSPHPDGSDAEVVIEGVHPVWHPGGTAFVFAPDGRRPAVLVLPDRLELLPESTVGVRRVSDRAFSADGRHLALLFENSQVAGHDVDVRSFPSGEMELSVALPDRATRLSFEGETLLLSGNEADAYGLLPNGTLRSAYRLAGAQLELLAASRGRLLVAERKSESTIRLVKDGVPVKTVAQGGRYYQATASEAGDVLLSRLNPEERRWQVAYVPAGSRELRALTEGPLDWEPSFVDGGRGFLYVRDTREVRVCARLSDPDDCRTAYTHNTEIALPSLSPDGTLIALLSQWSTGRVLDIVSLSDGVRKAIGPFARYCKPVWASATTIWMPTVKPAEWAEVDVRSGTSTGRLHNASIDSCTPPASPQSTRFSIEAEEKNETTIHVTEAH